MSVRITQAVYDFVFVSLKQAEVVCFQFVIVTTVLQLKIRTEMFDSVVYYI